MIVAHVYFAVAAPSREAALDILLAELPRVSKMKGCIRFMPFLDGARPEGLGVLHEWESDADFSAYAGSASFAALGKALRPMMIASPMSRRFDATLRVAAE